MVNPQNTFYLDIPATATHKKLLKLFNLRPKHLQIFIFEHIFRYQ